MTDRPEILIVSTDRVISGSLQAALAAQGYGLHVAASWKDALSQAREIKPGAILLNAVKNIGRGFAFCERMYKHPATRNIPVIFLYGPSGLQRKTGLHVVRANRYLTMPVAGADLIESVREVLGGAQPRPAEPPLNGTRILVVEDNRLVREFIREALEQNGCEVRTADAGPQAIKAAARDLPDAVILNLVMPGMDGFEVCRSLALNEKTRHIPVIIESAKNDIKTIARAFATGASRYLVKPFSQDELLTNIRHAIKSSGTPQS